MACSACTTLRLRVVRGAQAQLRACCFGDAQTSSKWLVRGALASFSATDVLLPHAWAQVCVTVSHAVACMPC